MTTGILDNLEKLVTDDLTAQTATVLAEKYDSTNHAVAASAAVILNGMLKASRKPAAGEHIASLLADPANDGAVLSNLGQLFKGQVPGLPIAGLSSIMQSSLFGGGVGTLAQSIGRVSGVKSTSAASVVNIMTPLIISSIGKELRASGDTSAKGLSRLLEKEAASIEGILPQELVSYASAAGDGFTPAAPAVATTTAAAIPAAPVIAAAAPVIAAATATAPTVAMQAAEAAKLAVEAEIRRKADADAAAHRAAAEAEVRRKAEADAAAHRAAAEAEIRRKAKRRAVSRHGRSTAQNGDRRCNRTNRCSRRLTQEN